jgi:hypothetical protein
LNAVDVMVVNHQALRHTSLLFLKNLCLYRSFRGCKGKHFLSFFPNLFAGFFKILLS